METIFDAMTNITVRQKQTQTNSKTELWREWLPEVLAEMKRCNIDDDPKGFSQVVAKICTCENKKGLIMYGPPGSGKTERLRFLAKTSPANIEIVSAQTICDWWAAVSDKPAVLREYYNCDIDEYNSAMKEMRVCDICIDDLGTEQSETVSFGNRCDVIRDVFLPMRYNIFPQGKTYITTNLYPDQLKDRYGERIWSRFQQMFFFLPVEHADRRFEDV